MRLGLDSKENGQSRTYSLAMHRAPLASTQEGRAREVSESVRPWMCVAPPMQQRLDQTQRRRPTTGMKSRICFTMAL